MVCLDARSWGIEDTLMYKLHWALNASDKIANLLPKVNPFYHRVLHDINYALRYVCRVHFHTAKFCSA